MSRLLLILVFALSSCTQVSKDIKPTVQHTVQDRYLQSLPSAFCPLCEEEIETNWGKEMQIGLSFARELDLYRAITALRRAEVLTPDKDRKLQAQYEILLAYYIGKKYAEVERTFSKSELSSVPTTFPAYHDLLVILYDTYSHLGDEKKAHHVLGLIRESYPATFNNLAIYASLKEADFKSLKTTLASNPDLQKLLEIYASEKKSITTAAVLSAALPGAGYLYVGQKQTALTAFLINGAFIAATVQFFMKGHIAAGIITAGFEAGWYFGGIDGAARSAKIYNERLYERLFSNVMNQKKLFPIYMLKNGF